MWDMILERLLRSLIKTGVMTVNLPSGKRFTCGNGEDPNVVLTIHDRALPRKLIAWVLRSAHQPVPAAVQSRCATAR